VDLAALLQQSVFNATIRSRMSCERSPSVHFAPVHRDARRCDSRARFVRIIERAPRALRTLVF
jgi:hypothetical protein